MAMYALVDASNFYASCEQNFRPSLKGVPLVVLSNNDLTDKFVSRMCHVFRSSGLLVLGFIVSLRRVAGGGLGEETERNDICG